MHVQQNNTTLVQSPLTIVDQEMRWAYSTNTPELTRGFKCVLTVSN